jgi:hypothetical protein
MCRSRKHHQSVFVQAGDVESLSVRYLGGQQIAVSGTFTGNLYRFSPLASVQLVDPRDAFHLLNSGLFGIGQ